MSDRVALVIDRIKCDGHGVCADLVPELIELDDWGYPIVRGGGDPAGGDPACPARGLRLPDSRTAPAGPRLAPLSLGANLLSRVSRRGRTPWWPCCSR